MKFWLSVACEPTAHRIIAWRGRSTCRGQICFLSITANAQEALTVKLDAHVIAPESCNVDVEVSIRSVSALLRSFKRSEELVGGRDLHSLLCKFGLDASTFLSNCLIDMYGRLSHVAEAHAVFRRILEPNIYSFNIMLKILSRNSMLHEVCALFDRIPTPDLYSWTILMNAYGQSGFLDDAMDVFQRIDKKNVVVWTAIIGLHSQNQRGQEALDLFFRMQMEGFTGNNLTLTCALDACAITGSIEEGQNIHSYIFFQNCTMDIELATSLINMYGKCGNLSDAWKCFSFSPCQNVAPWTAMISALSKHGHSIEALHLLCKMQLLGIKPDNIAYVCVLEACASIDSLEAGQLIHMSIIDAGFYGNGAYVENALVVMYGILSSVDDAQSVFHNSSNRGVVSLTAMAGALLQAGHGKETLELFSQALLEGTVLDKIILLCAVDACASLASLDKGLEIHTIVLNGGHCQDLEVGNALVNMYGKCAALHHASSVLFKMSRRDIFSWNTLISACVQNGGEEQVWSLLYKMELEGLKADETTFHSILTACSHAGWNEMGKYTFCLLINDEFILPCADYHVCMVDLLGRSGLLEEAEYAAHVVNHGKNALAWLCLLGACKVHGDVERGLKAARFCMEMDPKNSAVYILLSNIYSMSD